MKGIRVDRLDLLHTLEGNRDAHLKVYQKALRGYRIASLNALEKLVKQVKGGKKFELYIPLVKPVHHKEEYDTIIGMLRMHSEETVELTQQDYVQFVEDNWNWRQSFMSNATMYTGVSGSSGYSGYSGGRGIKFASDEK